MRRDPGEARLLGLWTAGCLAVLLLAGILWVGDLALQWPVLLVPLVWALVAVRPRRRGPAPTWDDDPYPATREAPTLPPPPDRPYRREW
ncbi:hypothetical protein [Blastococcus sp. TF02A-26]|uniref:hypothetical protein n=1 Tax=Blastococcus sp. TF02A-26 TaxID=2250577 RepID=UPI000DEB9394|nr:hypothetical protein [Blastococcus sp. TF02A-26]RBY86086.1 hypothetical protein DQ240_09720 [Blastococcus sp. TF02A-26]